MSTLADKIQVRPGWLIWDDSWAESGIRYERIPIIERSIRGGGLEKRFETRKVIDNVAAVAAVDAVVKKMAYALRKNCTRVSFGWYADDIALEAVLKEEAVLREEMAEANLQAEVAGSARRGDIYVVPFPVDPKNERAVRQIQRSILAALTELRGYLRTAEIGNPLTVALLKHRNLDRLVLGSQSAAISLAFDSVSVARNEVRKRLREMTPAQAGELDLGPLDSAINMFTVDET